MKKPSDSFSKASRSPSPQAGDVGQALGRARSVRLAAAQQAEQARLALLAVALLLLARPPWPGRWPAKSAARRASSESKRAALDEALHHPPVHGAQVHALAEVEERAEGAAVAPRAQDRPPPRPRPRS